VQSVYLLAHERRTTANMCTTPRSIANHPEVVRKRGMVMRAEDAQKEGISFTQSARIMGVSPATLYTWRQCVNANRCDR